MKEKGKKILRNLCLEYHYFRKAYNGFRPLFQYDSQNSETIHPSLHTSFDESEWNIKRKDRLMDECR